MSTDGWIFMVGFRVFDVGLLVGWLVWFFRLRDDEDDPPEEGGGGGGGESPGPGPRRGPGGGGLDLPLGRWPAGARGLLARGPSPAPRRRGAEPPIRAPLPARVRVPGGDPMRIRR